MTEKTIDLGNFCCTGALHDRLAKTFDFPDYYGRNLDALHDLLTDIREDTHVTILMPERPRPADCGSEACAGREVPVTAQTEAEKNALILATYAARVRMVFCDSAEENPHLTVEVKTSGSDSQEEQVDEKA